GIEATNSIYVTEVIGPLDLRFANAITGDIRLTVRETAATGEDLTLYQPTGTILVVENAPRTIPHGLINAAGWVLLRVADKVTLGNTAPIATGIADAA